MQTGICMVRELNLNLTISDMCIILIRNTYCICVGSSAGKGLKILCRSKAKFHDSAWLLFVWTIVHCFSLASFNGVLLCTNVLIDWRNLIALRQWQTMNIKNECDNKCLFYQWVNWTEYVKQCLIRNVFFWKNKYLPLFKSRCGDAVSKRETIGHLRLAEMLGPDTSKEWRWWNCIPSPSGSSQCFPG